MLPPSGTASMPRPAGAAATPASTSAALSLILHCSKHTHADLGWDAAGLDHATLLDLILASKDLGNRGLFDLAYNTVAAMVDRKSSDEIRAHQRPQSWRRRCWLSATSPGTASQRSGSGWFETLPNSHVNVGSNGEIFSNKERGINFSSVIKTMDKASLWSWC